MSKKSSKSEDQRGEVDLNNPQFQAALFTLEKSLVAAVIGALAKIAQMSWTQVYRDSGLKWELIYSYKGPNGEPRYSLRISKGFRAVAFREGNWMRLLTLHPDHDSAYRG
jgi:DNA-binding phage protein